MRTTDMVSHGEQHIAYGPGEPGYVAQLKAYDQAFAKFFARLTADGITKANTLFVVTVEEGDHFAGAAPTPAGCDGVTTPCTYSLLGEVNGNLAGLLATQQAITTPFTVHADMAPTVYLTGNPARSAPVTRNFERARRAADGRQSLHRSDRAVDRGARRPGRDEDPAHDYRRPATNPDVRNVRRARLLPVRRCSRTAPRRASRCRRRRRRSRGTTEANNPRSPRRGSASSVRAFATSGRTTRRGPITRTGGRRS